YHLCYQSNDTLMMERKFLYSFHSNPNSFMKSLLLSLVHCFWNFQRFLLDQSLDYHPPLVSNQMAKLPSLFETSSYFFEYSKCKVVSMKELNDSLSKY